LNRNPIHLRDLHFTRNERRSIVILLVTALILHGYPLVFEGSKKSATAPSDTLDSLIQILLEEGDAHLQLAKETPFYPPTDTMIDPNIASMEGLLLIGIPERAASNLIKYRDRGGRIHSATDLLKIYGMDSVLFEKIRENILVIDASPPPSENDRAITKLKAHDREMRSERPDTPPFIIMDLNSATPEELTKLKGIGPVLSERIVKYRSILGGFYQIEQLREVYGLPAETFDAMKTHLQIGSPVQRLDIQKAEFSTLLRHPYLDYDMVKKIFSLRRDSTSMEAILDSLRAEHFDINGLIPYLKVTGDENKL
jgi:competence ComEA-like helix-hairpin-helix protein